MKKFLLSVLLITVLLTSTVTVGAANVGDVINKVVYTDIVATINNYDIASFNLNGYTVVVVEDLRNYGFDVQWNQQTRSLSVKRAQTNDVASKYVARYVPASQVGVKMADVLYTDIVTYINDAYVPSFNINGQTVIYFSDLAQFGSMNYDNATRKISLNISDGLKYNMSTSTISSYYPGTTIPTYTSVTGVSLKRQDALSDGTPLYVYSFSNTDDVKMYWDKLVANGWSPFKDDDPSTDEKFESSFSKGYNLLLMNIYWKYNEIWIVCG